MVLFGVNLIVERGEITYNRASRPRTIAEGEAGGSIAFTSHKLDEVRRAADLEVATHTYPAEHNGHSKPFVWTATDADMLDKVTAGKPA